MQWEGVEAGFKHWPTFCGKCSWKEHSPWHLVKEACKVTLLMPLVKNQIKHYQGSGGGGTQRKPSLWFTLDTRKYHFLNRVFLHLLETVTFYFITATLNRHSSTSEGIARDPRVICPSMHMCTRRQWGQYRTVNWTISRKWQEDSEEKLCSMVPSSASQGRPGTSRTVQ